MTVDEILASRFYRDRAGRGWNAVTFWASAKGLDTVQKWACPAGLLSQDQMRLLIERDKHRDECMGLGSCPDHPVPIVCQNFNEDGATAWEVVGAHRGNGLIFDLPHSHAMNMARAWAVGE